MKHPHADVLIAIAENVEAIDDFEIKADESVNWDDLIGYSEWLHRPEKWSVRRQQKTIKVNGFDVPEPCRVMPEIDSIYYIAAPSAKDMFSYTECREDIVDRQFIDRGLIHLTKEAAIAHAKAMLGIDPNEADK